MRYGKKVCLSIGPSGSYNIQLQHVVGESIIHYSTLEEAAQVATTTLFSKRDGEGGYQTPAVRCLTSLTSPEGGQFDVCTVQYMGRRTCCAASGGSAVLVVKSGSGTLASAKPGSGSAAAGHPFGESGARRRLCWLGVCCVAMLPGGWLVPYRGVLGRWVSTEGRPRQHQPGSLRFARLCA